MNYHSEKGLIPISDLVFAKNLFDLCQTSVPELFTDLHFVWEAIPRLPEVILQLVAKLPADFDQIAPAVWVGKGTRIAPTALIKGPAINGYDCEIRHAAFIRENVIVGNGAVIGNSAELKNSLLFHEVQVPHFNYVGDSILGYRSHLGAGVILSNLKSAKNPVTIKDVDGIPYETGLRKLGALLGDRVEVGCNSVLNPGTIVGPETIIYPLTAVRGIIPGKSILKSDGRIIPRD